MGTEAIDAVQRVNDMWGASITILVVVLAVITLAIFFVARWTGNNVVKPWTAKAIATMDHQRESTEVIKDAMTAIKESSQKQVDTMKEISDTVGEVHKRIDQVDRRLELLERRP